MNQLHSSQSHNNMHFNHAFVIAYFINAFLLVNNIAFNLSYGHRKRELSLGNAGANPRDDANSQQSQLSDPGYTKQHENEDLKKLLSDKNTNLTNAQNWLELLNPTGQMFHVIYMLPNPQKRELNGPQPHAGGAAQEENLAYAGPHLFPSQFDDNNPQDSIQQLNLPFKNFNNAFQNAYSNPLVAPQYYQNLVKDSKVATKMEAPFIPSQFLGYDQNQRQHMAQQQPQQQQHQQQQQPQFMQHNQPQHPQQHLPSQNQLVPQQGQLLPNQNQLLPQLNPMLLPHQQHPILKTVPVYEHHEDLPFRSSNQIYMSPNNMYNLYRKPN